MAGRLARRWILSSGALLGAAALGSAGTPLDEATSCGAGEEASCPGPVEDASAMLQTRRGSALAEEVSPQLGPWHQADKDVGGLGPMGAPSAQQLEAARKAADAAPMQELAEPKVVRSPVTLKMTQVKLPTPWIGGYFWTRGYESIPGPTIRVKPGEKLKIILENDLGPGPGYEGCDMANANLGFFLNPDTICALNHTNLHVHGLHVSSKGKGDNIFRHAEPGKKEEFLIDLPKNHMGGTHLYHPHFHHATAAQAGGGAHGAIVVDDPKGSLPQYVEDMPEKVMVLSLANIAKIMRLEAWSLGTVAKGDVAEQVMWKNSAYPDWRWNPVSGTIQEHGSAASDNWGLDPHVLVNGQYKPKLTLEEGKWYRLRFVFASVEQRVEIHQVEDAENQADCNFQLLAKDGIYLHEAPRPIDRVFLASGGRADVAVQCKCGFLAPRPCHSNLNFTAVWQPMGMMGMAPTIESTTNRLFHIETKKSGQPHEKHLETFSVRRPCYLVDLREVSVSRKNRHKVELPMLYPMAVKVDGVGSPWGHGTPPPMATIPVGQVQEWHLQGIQYHPYHLHVNPYQIVKIWSDPYFLPGDWHDTMLPTNINFATVRVNVDTFTGKMIAHCHLLEHEDNGMMGYWQIEGKEGTKWPGASKVDPQCYDGDFPGPPTPRPPFAWR